MISVRFTKVCASIRHKLCRTGFGFEDIDRLSGCYGLCTKQSATTVSFIYWNNLKQTHSSLHSICIIYFHHNKFNCPFTTTWMCTEVNAALQCVCFVPASVIYGYYYLYNHYFKYSYRLFFTRSYTPILLLLRHSVCSILWAAPQLHHVYI